MEITDLKESNRALFRGIQKKSEPSFLLLKVN